MPNQTPPTPGHPTFARDCALGFLLPIAFGILTLIVVAVADLPDPLIVGAPLGLCMLVGIYRVAYVRAPGFLLGTSINLGLVLLIMGLCSMMPPFHD